MTVAQIKRQVGQGTFAAASSVFIDLPSAHYLGALELHLDLTVTDSSAAAITVVDSTLGAIPIVTNVQLVLDGATIPLNISGQFLDYWSHIDRPGSERLATSSTTSGAEWDAVLRYELAQSIANLTGVIPLHQISSARLEIEFGAVSLIATSANTTTVSGSVKVYAEMYDNRRPIPVDTSVVHTLRVITVDVTSTGEKIIKLPTGRQLQRLIVIAENNSAYTWALLDSLTFRMGQGDDPYEMNTPIFRAWQRRHYGGDDIPITGVYVFDFRGAGPRDVVPMGDINLAPDPHLVINVPSGTSLTTARAHLILEELEPVANQLV